jgi:serine/threonine protein kinase
MSVSPSQMTARRYRIERYLTEGGMGAIYIGKKLGPVGFEKEVVLKQLLPEYTARPEFRDLFFREAKISATLDHANIVHTFDLVESEESLFIVMEYVRGVDLRTIIRRAKLRRRELAPAAALHVAQEVLTGLAYAHNRRTPAGASLAIIHRDVSPSNILCSAEGEVKLSDFGIAKAATHSSVFYRVRGKVGYMSPEQARGQAIDHRTDLYSVAVCLYEALTAERLFIGDLSTPADQIYSQPIVPPSQKRPALPKAIDTVLGKALAEQPDRRYQNATAFAEALRQVAHREGLLFSAPQLGEHLRAILGRDQTLWLSDERASPSGDPSTHKLPGTELEGKEASSIGVVGDDSNLYVGNGGDVVSPEGVAGRDKFPPPSLHFPDELEEPTGPGRDHEDDTTRRLADPASAGDFSIRVEDDQEEPTNLPRPRRPSQSRWPVGEPGATPPPPVLQPKPPRRATPPPPPRQALFPDSPFEQETPPPPVAQAFFDGVEFADPDEPPPARMPPPSVAPSAYAGPPAGRMPRGLPRPSGYLEQAINPNLRMPPAPPHQPAPPAVYDPAYGQPAQFGRGSFEAGPETVDFGRGTAPVATLQRRSGPPGILVLILALSAAAGGAKLAQYVTRADVAALDARSK